MSSTPPIIVSSEDRALLLQLVASGGGGATAELEAELERARVVPSHEVPDDVVVMSSQLEYEVEPTHQRRRLTLVHPREADPDAGRVSVLAPLGAALLGLRVGQSIDWRMPGGMRRLRVLSVARTPPTRAER